MNVIGAASVDVTPSVGTTLAGYSREVGSIGVLDRLTASAFVVGDGVRQVCLISVDTLGLATPFVDEVRFEVSETLGLPQHAVFVFATHTHSGTDCFGTDEASREYMEGLRHALLRAARTASDSLRPCRITWSQIPTSIGVNRRERTSEGSVIMGVNPDGPVDRRLGSVQFTDPETSELLATLLIATAHANVLKGDSNVVSADYPGWSRGVLEQALGCPVLVVIGSAGNVNARWRGNQRDLERMARMVGGGVLEQVADHTDRLALDWPCVQPCAEDKQSPCRIRYQAMTPSGSVVLWTDPLGAWVRTTFKSRAEDLIICQNWGL